MTSRALSFVAAFVVVCSALYLFYAITTGVGYMVADSRQHLIRTITED